MDRNMHFSIPYLPLRLRLECCEAASLPQYLGSALHGVLGWTLLSHRQAYQYIYENRRLRADPSVWALSERSSC